MNLYGRASRIQLSTTLLCETPHLVDNYMNSAIINQFIYMIIDMLYKI